VDIDESRQAIWRLVLQGFHVSLLLLVTPTSLISDTVTFGTGNNEFQIEFVEIGSIGNPDNSVIWPIRPPSGPDFELREVGAVDYYFQLGKYEISRDQVMRAVNEGALTIDLDPMSFLVGGPTPTMPATGISWYEAAIFVNWLNTSHGYSPAYNLTTVGWKWDETTDGFDPANLHRNGGAKYVLPDVDEWHKSAFYDAEAERYWAYATGSDQIPVAVTSGASSGTAVYGLDSETGPAPVTQAGGLTPFGVMAMVGNVSELEESVWDPANAHELFPDRGVRGGSWGERTSDIHSGVRGFVAAGGENSYTGLRVAMLPDADNGDFNRDGIIDVSDIDQLTGQILSGEVIAIRYDVSGDGLVNTDDRVHWVGEIMDTALGDANLDGVVDFADFLAMSSEFNEESGWAGGDFDGDGVTEFSDFLILSQNYGSGEFASVPEPSSLLLGILGFGGLSIARRRRFSPRLEKIYCTSRR